MSDLARPFHIGFLLVMISSGFRANSILYAPNSLQNRFCIHKFTLVIIFDAFWTSANLQLAKNPITRFADRFLNYFYFFRVRSWFQRFLHLPDSPSLYRTRYRIKLFFHSTSVSFLSVWMEFWSISVPELGEIDSKLLIQHDPNREFPRECEPNWCSIGGKADQEGYKNLRAT